MLKGHRGDVREDFRSPQAHQSDSSQSCAKSVMPLYNSMTEEAFTVLGMVLPRQLDSKTLVCCLSTCVFLAVHSPCLTAEHNIIMHSLK